MKDNMMKIINAHNEVVKAIANSPVKISGNQVIALSVISHKFACEALEIVHTARELGIDCKANMQTGEITF